MGKEITKETIGHLGVICAAPVRRRRSHIRKLSSQQKTEILTLYKAKYEEYQRKTAKA